MKWIVFVLLILIGNIAFAQVKKPIIEWCLEKDDSLQVMKKIDYKQDSIIRMQKKVIKADSTLEVKYKSDSTQYNIIIAKQDTIINNKNEEIGIWEDIHKKDIYIKIGLVILSLIFLLL